MSNSTGKTGQNDLIVTDPFFYPFFYPSQYFAENVTYSYDNRGQLTGADYASLSDEAYTYDENGNRTSGGFTSGTNNQLTTDGTYSYEYDGEGNRTRRYVDDNQNQAFDSGDTDITDYEWDHRIRLITVSKSSVHGGSITEQIDFAYDAFDRAISKTVDPDGAGGQTGETEFLIYDGRRAVLTLEPDGDVTGRSLWADAVDLLLAEEDALGETYFHLPDHLGSTRDVVDSSGELVNHLVFDSFGNILSQTNPSDEYTILYAALVWDGDVELYRSFTRYYDAAIASWTSEDPIGFGGGDANLARYVANSPTTYIDPTGLEGVIPGSGPTQRQPILGGPRCTGEWPTGPRISNSGAMRDLAMDMGFALMVDIPTTAWQNREIIGGILVEPYDWYLTAQDIYREPGNKWNYAGLLPLVPGRATRYGDEFIDLLDDLQRNLRIRGPRLGQLQGREFRPDQLELCEFDPNAPSHVRGWLKNERRRLSGAGGGSSYTATPPGYVLGHGRSTPAREGYDYSNARLQGEDLNKLKEQIRRRLRHP